MEGLRRASHWAADLLFPLECLSCGVGGRLFCGQCVGDLPELKPPFCPTCADPGRQCRCDWCRSVQMRTDGIRAPFLMEGAVREAVHRFKYRNLRAAAPELGALLAGYLASHPMAGDVLAPVPLHPRRLRGRGYNQAELLAVELGRLTGLPVAKELLTRRKDTPPQVQASSREDRVENVRDSFACIGDAGGLKVILVDDVSTTGSTMSACAGALKDSGAASVWGLALAREG